MRHEHGQVDQGAFSVLEGKNRFQCAWGSLASIPKLTSIGESFGGKYLYWIISRYANTIQIMYLKSISECSASLYALMLWVVILHFFYRRNNLDNSLVLKQVHKDSDLCHGLIIVWVLGGSRLKTVVQYDVVL